MANYTNQLQVHVAKIGEDVVVLARNKEGHLFEFLASDRLRNDLPTIVVPGHLHRFAMASQCLAIIPATSGWEPLCPPTWTMKFAHNGKSVVTSTRQPTVHLLCPNSVVAGKAYKIFSALESAPHNLFLTYNAKTLYIKLPRYLLNFWVNDAGFLESNELAGFEVSTNANIGTLFGLQSKLVLRTSATDESPAVTKMIVPNGRFRVASQSVLHPKLCISYQSDFRAFIYDVDDLLGRLVPADASVASWLHLAYMHCLTATHSEDPLTSRTGIQQALTILSSPQVISFHHFSKEDAATLELIIGLCPGRGYYPKHLRCMETVNWKTSMSSPFNPEMFNFGWWAGTGQMDALAPLIDLITSHANGQEKYSPPYSACKDVAKISYQGPAQLRHRASLRCARYTPWNAECGRYMSVVN